MRYSNPFVSGNGYTRGVDSATIDLGQAGTKQFAPNISNIAANTPFVKRNLIAFLIEPPRFFNFVDNPLEAVRSLKAFIEVHTRTIDGLNATLTSDNAGPPVGGSGETLQTSVNITRAPSTPSHGTYELQGRAIQKFIAWWLRTGIGDENTKTPLVVTTGRVSPTDYDATFYGATVLYIEPDAFLQEPVSAWLCTNWYPEGTGPWEGSKDAGQLGQTLDLNIQFTALTDISIGTQLLARDMLRRLNAAGLNPHEIPTSIDRINAMVQDSGNGLATQLEEGAASRVVY